MTTDTIIEAEVVRLVAESDDGTYAVEDLADRVCEALTIADMAALKRDHVLHRINYRDKKQGELARSTAQVGLPGEFAPPEGEFALGGGRRVPKAEARDVHWVIRLQLEAEHIGKAQASHAATLGEYAAYQPFLRTGVSTGMAYELYRQNDSESRAAD